MLHTCRFGLILKLTLHISEDFAGPSLFGFHYYSVSIRFVKLLAIVPVEVLKLLRAGAFVLTTTRYPHDCSQAKTLAQVCDRLFGDICKKER